MRAPFFLWISIIALSYSLSSAQNIDSLKLALKTAKNDTTKCNILVGLVEANYNNDKVWPIYNEQLKSKCEVFLKNCSSKHPLKFFYEKNIFFSY